MYPKIYNTMDISARWWYEDNSMFVCTFRVLCVGHHITNKINVERICTRFIFSLNCGYFDQIFWLMFFICFIFILLLLVVTICTVFWFMLSRKNIKFERLRVRQSLQRFSFHSLAHNVTIFRLCRSESDSIIFRSLVQTFANIEWAICIFWMISIVLFSLLLLFIFFFFSFVNLNDMQHMEQHVHNRPQTHLWIESTAQQTHVN